MEASCRTVSGRWPEVSLHTYGSYTMQDLMDAAAQLRTQAMALHAEVRRVLWCAMFFDGVLAIVSLIHAQVSSGRMLACWQASSRPR